MWGVARLSCDRHELPWSRAAVGHKVRWTLGRKSNMIDQEEKGREPLCLAM